MHVYFVRHGETSLNARRIHQSANTPLSEKGRDQACNAAEYLRAMNPELILTSGYTRALETSRIIGQVVGIKPQENNLFREIDRPTSLCGRSIFSPNTFTYVLSSVLHRKDPTWRYEDAENFSDIQSRVRSALAYIELLSKQHKSVVVVSHTIFINLMVAYMCHDRMIAVRDILPSFFNVGTMDNCSVVELFHNGATAPAVCPWELVVRNGTAVS